jgi:diamine N-acetyltransferase
MITKVITKTEIKAVEKLAKEIWTEHYTTIIGKEQVDYMLEKFQSEEAIANQITSEKYKYYLIRKNENYIGYAAIQVKKEELFLSKIYIKNSERGRGHGKKIITFIENLTKENKLNKITLTVNKNNIKTIKAYKNCGFKNIGALIQDIGNGFVMNDYVMEKICTPSSVRKKIGTWQ